MGHPWTKLFHDYNLLEGRLWVVVLIWVTISPLVLRQLRAMLDHYQDESAK